VIKNAVREQFTTLVEIPLGQVATYPPPYISIMLMAVCADATTLQPIFKCGSRILVIYRLQSDAFRWCLKSIRRVPMHHLLRQKRLHSPKQTMGSLLPQKVMHRHPSDMDFTNASSSKKQKTEDLGGRCHTRTTFCGKTL